MEKGVITIIGLFFLVRRIFFQQVYQNDYHAFFRNEYIKWYYGNKNIILLPYQLFIFFEMVKVLPYFGGLFRIFKLWCHFSKKNQKNRKII